MPTVCATATPVNTVLPALRGQPSKQTAPRLRVVNRTLVQAALAGTALPSDADLARQLGVGERTVRTMRLKVLGLNRHELKGWRRAVFPTSVPDVTGQPELICTTPFAGLWLLAPQIIGSGLARAAESLKIIERTRVQAIQVVLTLVAWAALGFQRLMHVDDFRHWADMGLALFTGSLHLWSDTTLWRWVHGLTPKSAAQFYEATVSRVAARRRARLYVAGGSGGGAWRTAASHRRRHHGQHGRSRRGQAAHGGVLDGRVRR